ncbi:translocon-associated protein subunit delta [Cylas formicarius]|uniref:translocon-associated protein subunit delta n=1 Tax=Cylas formicarius TaxID=197179 RepID=UPI00295890AA|nr:translocon-associated protein subunit delta [Cylas formicarius]
MKQQIVLASFFFVSFTGFCGACTNPQVTSKSFTTQDATIVSHIAYVSDFSVKCSSGEAGSLYAELEDGSITPVAIVGPQSYQVSWTEESKAAKSGDRIVRIFNEDGYTAIRKLLRAGESSYSVEPFFTAAVRHPGSYNGPWVKSEFIAAIAALVVSYFAIATRAKIVS